MQVSFNILLNGHQLRARAVEQSGHARVFVGSEDVTEQVSAHILEIARKQLGLPATTQSQTVQSVREAMGSFLARIDAAEDEDDVHDARDALCEYARSWPELYGEVLAEHGKAYQSPGLGPGLPPGHPHAPI